MGNLGQQHYTGAFLYFDDCLALGKKAIEIGAEAMAYQWLTSAPLSPPELDSPQEHLNEDMWELEQTWLKLMKLTKLGNHEDMHRYLKHKKQRKLKGLYDYKYYATCRGETTMVCQNMLKLKCKNIYKRALNVFLNCSPRK